MAMQATGYNKHMKAVRLIPYSPLPCLHDIDLCVQFALSQGHRLQLSYQLTGDLRTTLIPPLNSSPQRKDGLWQHLCFEAFIKPEAGLAYWEFNFSPSGDWAIYRFDDYRTGMTAPTLMTPPALRISPTPLTTRADEHSSLSLTVEIDLAQLDPSLATPRLQLALASVIETRRGELSCWAGHHPTDKPDFHHPGSFTQHLYLPAQEPSP